MSSISVSVEGLSRLRATLAEAGAQLDDLKAAHAAAAQFVADTAAARAPVRTGALANSIRSSGTKRAGVIRAGNKAVPYAGPIHWGWPSRNIKANRFMTDAAATTEAAWVELFYQHITAALEAVEGD